MIDIVEILTHWHAGRNKAEVARSLGVDRGTVAKYIAKAEAEGYVPGSEPLSPERWSTLVHGWFPELVDLSRCRHRSTMTSSKRSSCSIVLPTELSAVAR